MSGLRTAATRRLRLAELVAQGGRAGDAEIFLISETHCHAEDVASWSAEWSALAGADSFSVWAPIVDNDRGAGVAVLYIRRPGSSLPAKKIDEFIGDDGRTCVALTEWDGRLWSFWSVYAPARCVADRADFFQKCDWQEQKFVNPILGGDFNVALVSGLDCSDGVVHPTTADQRALRDMTNLLGVEDTFRVFHKKEKAFTFGRPNESKKRLDYFFTPVVLRASIAGCSIASLIVRVHDHNAVELELLSQLPQKKGSKFWKLAPEIMGHPDAPARVAKVVGEVALEAINQQWSPLQHWLTLKECLRRTLMDLTRVVALRRKASISKRQRRIERMRKNLSVLKPGPGLDLQFERIRKEEAQLMRMTQDKFEVEMLKKGARMRKGWERSTSFFHRAGKTASRPAALDKLLDPATNVVVTTEEDAAQVLRTFFSAVFKAPPDNVDEAAAVGEKPLDMNALNELLGKIRPRISAAQAASLDESITIKEMLEAANAAKRGSSPGKDGITAEFYIRYWDLIGPVLHKALLWVVQQEDMGPEMTSALVYLLLKKGRDRLDPGSWRPLSLLGCDYKIFARVLARRLNPLMPQLCSCSQTAYVRYRNITETMSLTQGVIQLAKDKNMEWVLLFFDAEKAFDRVNWTMLFDHLMPKLGFGSAYIKMVKLTYRYWDGDEGRLRGAIAELLVNGNILPGWELSRGVRQGDPLAALLFALVMELVDAAVAVTREKGMLIEGVAGPGGAIALNAFYADDTRFYLKSVASVPGVVSAMGLFNDGTGGKTNLIKSLAHFPGCVPSVVLKKVISDSGLKLLHGAMREKDLGIPIGDDVTAEEIYEPMIARIAKAIARFKRFKLSIAGRVLVAHTYMLSGLWFAAPLYDVPVSVLDRVKVLLSHWLWNGTGERRKPGRINENVAALSREDGGIGMFKVEEKLAAIRMRFMLRLLNGEAGCWKPFAMYTLVGEKLAELGPRALLLPDALRCVPRRCSSRTTALAFGALLGKLLPAPSQYGMSIDGVREQPIFFNASVSENGAPLNALANNWMEGWVRRDVTRIGHLLDDNGVLLKEAVFKARWHSDASWKVHARYQRQGRSGRMAELSLVWACIPAAWKEVLRIGAQADVARKRGPSFPAVSNLYVIGGAGGGMVIGAAIQSVYEVASLSEGPNGTSINLRARAVDEWSRVLAPMSGPPVTLVLHDQLATLRQVAVSVEGETQRLLGLFSEGHDVLSRLGLVRGGAGNEKWYALQGMYSRNLHDLIRTRHVGELRCTVKWREKAAGAGATMPKLQWQGPKSVFAANAGGDLHSPAEREFYLWFLHRKIATAAYARHWNDNQDCASCVHDGIGGGLVNLPGGAMMGGPQVAAAPEETLEHLFWACQKVRRVWALALNTFTRVRGRANVHGALLDADANDQTWCFDRYLHALLAPTPEWPAVAEKPSVELVKIWSVLRMEAMRAIWKFRCRARDFADHPAVFYTADDVTAAWQAGVRRRVLEERVSLSKGLTMAHWLANGGIAVENNLRELVFHGDIGGVVSLFNEDDIAEQDGMFSILERNWLAGE